MTEPLKPCPFCGSDRLDTDNDHMRSFWVYCTDCGARGPLTQFRQFAYKRQLPGGDALMRSMVEREQWNRRAADDSTADREEASP